MKINRIPGKKAALTLLIMLALGSPLTIRQALAQESCSDQCQFCYQTGAPPPAQTICYGICVWCCYFPGTPGCGGS